MVSKRPTNEDIHIGEIFMSTSSDETEHSCEFYQVVGLRARTLVELRCIRDECFVDETCRLAYSEVRVRPLPGQFVEGSEPFTVRAAGISEYSGEKVLCEINPEFRNWPTVYFEVREGKTGRLSGYAGVYAMRQLEKEGKLPSWAKKSID